MPGFLYAQSMGVWCAQEVFEINFSSLLIYAIDIEMKATYCARMQEKNENPSRFNETHIRNHKNFLRSLM